MVTTASDWEWSSYRHDFAEVQEDWLKKYVVLEHGVPSADTIARVFSLIDPNQFAGALAPPHPMWTNSI